MKQLYFKISMYIHPYLLFLRLKRETQLISTLIQKGLKISIEEASINIKGIKVLYRSGNMKCNDWNKCQTIAGSKM
jgi:hypothetical protein